MGEQGHESGEPYYSYISAQAKAALEQSRNASGRYERMLAEGVDLLDQEHEDILYHVHAAWSDPAFNIGLALGVYLPLNGGAR